MIYTDLKCVAFLVCVCVMYAHMQIYTSVCTQVEARGAHQMSSSTALPPYFLETGAVAETGVPTFFIWTGWPESLSDPPVCDPLSTVVTDLHSYAQLFMWKAWEWTQVLMLVHQAFLPTGPSSVFMNFDNYTHLREPYYNYDREHFPHCK